MLRTAISVLAITWIAAFAFAARAEPANANAGATAQVEFEKTRHDFGDLSHYSKPEVVFKFTNTGDRPVNIKIARASSEVGRPTWPEEPIAPGEIGEILVKVRTRYGGPFRVHVDVVEETDGSIATLVMTGNVLSREDSPKP